MEPVATPISEFFAQFPDEIKRHIEFSPDYKEWRRCANCSTEEGRLQRCSRCANSTMVSVYYCGTICQKSHWKHHKPQCDYGHVLQQHLEDDDVSKTRKFLDKWCHTNGAVMTWAVRQAFRLNPDIDTNTTYLKIKCVPRNGVMGTNTYEATFRPVSFQICPRSSLPDCFKFPLSEKPFLGGGIELQGVIHVRFVERLGPYGGEDLAVAAYEPLLKTCEQWPWIFTEVALVNYRGWDEAFWKTINLARVAVKNGEVGGSLESFSAPSLEGGAEWKLPRYDQWKKAVQAADPWPGFTEWQKMFIGYKLSEGGSPRIQIRE